MKVAEKRRARELRAQGHTIPQILKEVSVSKGTLSVWLRDLPLSEAHLQVVHDARHERIGNSVRLSRDRRWGRYLAEADELWPKLSQNQTFMFGLALYAGEGAKTNCSLQLSNCDLRILRKTIEFYEVLGVDRCRLHAGIHIHDSSRAEVALSYWSSGLGITREQFHRPVIKVSGASKRLRNTQAYGTCRVGVHSTRLLQMVLHWLDLALTCMPP